MAAVDPAAIRDRLQRLAWLLDASMRVPVLGTRVGFDALIGLVPGVGDAVGVALSGWIIEQARRAGVPGSVLARMIGNVAVEGLIGLVPLLGDLFDAGWKANLRNVALFDDWLSRHRPVDDAAHTTRTARAEVTATKSTAGANGAHRNASAVRGA